MNAMDVAAMGYCLSLFAIVGCWVFWPDIERWAKRRQRQKRQQAQLRQLRQRLSRR